MSTAIYMPPSFQEDPMNPSQFASGSAILNNLLNMTARKRAVQEARSAVAGKMREQQQQGVRSYAPNNVRDVADELSHRLVMSNFRQNISDAALPKSEEVKRKYFGPDDLYKSASHDVYRKEKESAAASDLAGAQITQRPSGGVVVRTPDKTFVTSRYGTGVSLPKSVGAKTIEGKPADEWYAEAAARQGQNNKFAASIPTGKVDELGRPQFRGIAFADSDRMSPEKQKSLIFEAMNRKKA